MKLSSEELKKIAHLARLEWDDSKEDTMGTSLNNILTYMEELSKVDTNGVEPTVHAVEQANVWREDQPHQSLDREAALQNAPERDGVYFKVPKLV